MARNLSLRDLSVLVTAGYALSLLVMYKVFLVTLRIGNIDLSGQIAQVPGMPIASLGVVTFFGIGAIVRRTRKHWDRFDKVAVITSFVFPSATMFITPVREFVLAEPAIGLAGAVVMFVPYGLFIER